MNKQAKKSKRSKTAFDTYEMGDALVGGELFDPLTGRFDFRPLSSEVVNVVGNPANLSGEPTMRAATLDDVEDDCPLCQEMRRQILAGNPPQVLAYE